MNALEAVSEDAASCEKQRPLFRPQLKVLFVSRLLAMPDHHGGCVYADAVLRHLHERGCEILYVWLADPLSPTKPFMRMPQLGSHISRFFVPNAIVIGRWMWCCRSSAWLCLPSYLLRKGMAKLRKKHVEPDPNHQAGAATEPTAAEVAFLQGLLESEAPDAVFVDMTEIANVLNGGSVGKTTPPLKLVLTHNVIHQRVAAYRKNRIALDFLPLTREQETVLLGKADVIVAIQHTEAAEFRAMMPQKKVVVVSMPATPHILPASAQVEGRCMFVGGATAHNVDGLIWLLEKIWPSVRRNIPNATLVICGAVGGFVKRPHPGVNILGNVPKLDQLYAEASVCLVPLRTGSGLKIKLIEAMRFGRAAVATAAGVEGFSDLEQGSVLPVTDSAEDFAARIVALLTDATLRETSVARQTAWITENLSADSAIGPLWEIIRNHAAKRPVRRSAWRRANDA